MLSVLGIIIGTAAVITVMAFGEGSMQDAIKDIERQGATNVIIRSMKPADDASSQKRTMTITYGLTYADYEQFLLLDSVVSSVPMRIFPQEIRHLHRMYNGRVVATTARYSAVNKIELVEGRFLTDDDDADPRAGPEKCPGGPWRRTRHAQCRRPRFRCCRSAFSLPVGPRQNHRAQQAPLPHRRRHESFSPAAARAYAITTRSALPSEHAMRPVRPS